MENPLSLVVPVITAITWVLAIAGALAAVFAAVDASARRPDAYTAADKQSKGVWAGITVASAVVAVLGALNPGSPFGPQQLLWLAAVVGTLVYLLDVRPRLREAQRGSRW
ncbi:DUF2516 family protein [Nakamurella endophytica]|uniref:DUF2516 family protein n=1 Tax=Nakamurella endophytica TaxID=1748367 RepID=A0A917SZW6_9ACTN|nr:DUF2516 family protein [Nakamurella endophytica]GGM04334.1 hypothetical protein GCM10011594_25700 [Nakamurella endophytica]